MPLIVVVEQSADLRKQWRDALKAERFEVFETEECSALPDLLRKCAIGLIIVGRVAGDPLAALDAIRPIRSLSAAPVLFLPASSSESIAIAALRAPVNEYLPPPVDPADVLAAVRRLVARETEPLDIVGTARAVARIKTILPKVANNRCHVLITGETGTGKELVAEHIHSLGPRRSNPFVAVNCAAIPETLLESELFGYERGAFTGAARRTDGLLHAADGGTLLLDEIGDLSLAAQAKILRAIETGRVQRVGAKMTTPVDVRFVTATNQNLESMVEEGRFRADLYFRINVARIDLPPLRERPEDIPLLVRRFLDEAGASATSVSGEAAALLAGFSWPGNIRQLRNVIQATLVYLSGPVIRIEDLPESFVQLATGVPCPAQSERNRLLEVLEKTHWNKSRAADSLQWSRMTLYRKMAKHGIGGKPPRRSASAGTVAKAGAD